MFEWITEIDQQPFRYNNENGELDIKRLDSTGQLNEMSSVCQFFAYFDLILDENALTSLPTPNNQALEIILKEVVPHYVDVKQIFIDGKLKEINVGCLKKDSKKIIEDLLSSGIYPVIPDLYRTKNLNLATKTRKLKHYLVNAELINPLHIKEAEKIREFLVSSFFSESGSIML
ncbi:hypothetical protein JOC86_000491 [Bacillus pakistanensis]|uniref:Uncharacterized protein n=1 Tax=Rossellomorea pakistanensis TaxID=992288 RepID=A0ABS2N871_9BACI|nr:hypothetical protein [Bacillus pakistanensis]MBM7583954.1 hypothetical protein [Bacillus pakistanensis]